MSEAPERIWAWTSGQAAGIFDTSFHDNAGLAVEYTRADLSAAAEARAFADGWNAAIEAAVNAIGLVDGKGAAQCRYRIRALRKETP